LDPGLLSLQEPRKDKHRGLQQGPAGEQGNAWTRSEWGTGAILTQDTPKVLTPNPEGWLAVLDVDTGDDLGVPTSYGIGKPEYLDPAPSDWVEREGPMDERKKANRPTGRIEGLAHSKRLNKKDSPMKYVLINSY